MHEDGVACGGARVSVGARQRGVHSETEDSVGGTAANWDAKAKTRDRESVFFRLGGRRRSAKA